MVSGTRETARGSSRERKAAGPTCSTTRSGSPCSSAGRATVAPGTTIDHVVSNLDLFPTILEMTGIGVPDNLRIGGRSFVPLLRDPQNTAIAWDDTLFGQYDMHNGAVARMRTDPHPGMEAHSPLRAGAEDELFDLAADPGETRNLADAPAHRDRKADLARQLNQWMISIGDPQAAKDAAKCAAGSLKATATISISSWSCRIGTAHQSPAGGPCP